MARSAERKLSFHGLQVLEQQETYWMPAKQRATAKGQSIPAAGGSVPSKSDRSGAPSSEAPRVQSRSREVRRNEKLATRVARLVARDIATRKLAPGAPLLAENLMAQEFGVGRSSVREALRLLEAQGLISIRQGLGGGPVVGAPDGKEFGQTMTMFLQVRGTTFSHIMRAVVSMEGLSAAMVADRVHNGEAIDVDRLIHASETELDAPVGDLDVISAATGFHDLIRELAGNDVLALTSEAIAHLFTERTLALHNYHWDHEQRLSIHREHLKIAGAISAGDFSSARKFAEDHMISVTRQVEELFPRVATEIVEWR